MRKFEVIWDTNKKRCLPVAAILICYIILSVTWAIVNPPFESPDEVNHFSYIQYISQRGSLPRPGDDGFIFIAASHHPPLYYGVSAVLYTVATEMGMPNTDLGIWLKRVNPNYIWNNPQTNKEHNLFLHPETIFKPGNSYPYDLLMLRLFSVLLGTVSLIYAFKTSMLVFRSNLLLSLFAAGSMAFLPQFTYVTTSTTNDNSAILMGALLLYSVILLQKNIHAANGRHFFLLGLLQGVSVLAKISLLSLAPIILWLLFKLRTSWKKRLINLALFCFGFALIAGWWFYRNYQLYGDIIARPWNVNPAGQSWEYDPKSLLSPYFMSSFFLENVSQSFVGKFGHMSILPAPIYYQFYLSIYILSSIGLGLCLIKPIRSNFEMLEPGLLPPLIIAIALSILQLIYFNTITSQPQGRYLFHGLTAIVILFTIGYGHSILLLVNVLSTRLGQKKLAPLLSRLIFSLTIIAIALSNLYALLVAIARAF